MKAVPQYESTQGKMFCLLAGWMTCVTGTWKEVCKTPMTSCPQTTRVLSVTICPIDCLAACDTILC